MDNFDLRKYLAEGKLLKENIDFPEMEDEFEGAMDAMVVEPKVYLQDIIDASAEEIVSDDYYEIMNAVDQGIYSEDEAVKLAKAWAKDKLSGLAEGRLFKESLGGKVKYYVKYTTQDGKEVKSELMSKREAIYKERDLVDSGVKKSSVYKFFKNIDLNGKPYIIDTELDKEIDYRKDEKGKPIAEGKLKENIVDEDEFRFFKLTLGDKYSDSELEEFLKSDGYKTSQLELNLDYSDAEEWDGEIINYFHNKK